MSVEGSLFGLAYGDAMGKPTEFRSVAEIIERYGPNGPRDLPAERGTGIARVTDDTQMALAVADGLLAALEHASSGESDRDRHGALLGEQAPWGESDAALRGEQGLAVERVQPLTAAAFEPPVRGRFLQWWQSPENDRAPGYTCMHACEAMAGGLSWRDASIIGSKGCGANMRVTPIALPPGLSNDERAGAAQLQAAMTHGHPTALAASELTMFAVRWALDGVVPRDLPTLLRDRCEAQRDVYREEWLGDLWLRTHESSAEEWIARGWDECLGVLDRLDLALAHPDRDADPCLTTGAGWVAEEALATALHCALLFPDDPVAALSRAATTSGDSDSIAALAGAVIGAHHGMDAWPAAWRERIEYGAELARLATAWSDR